MLTKTGTCPACETEDVTLTAEWTCPACGEGVAVMDDGTWVA